MQFLIISGLSGAGKSRTADILEDLDFYCVDNMPVALMPKFAELCLATRGRYEHVALVTDVRSRTGFDELFLALDQLTEMELDCRILFVEASVETIVQRYKETRRRHPLAPDGGSIENAVRQETRLLARLRERADYVINTTGLTLGQLQQEICGLFVGENLSSVMNVNVMSFGIKYGIPIEADLVFDVRFLPNPYYVSELRPLTGRDAAVKGFVMSYNVTQEFLKKLRDLLSFLLPLYIEEGKHTLAIAIGCTGGRHRSVTVAEAVSALMQELGYSFSLIHRDIDKG